MLTAEGIFAAAAGTLLYLYIGYPLVLKLLVVVRGVRTVRKAPIVPHVSLVISAYNEELAIREKLENALALDYPSDRLDVVVISDASTDRTDDIVRQFAARGVRLLRQDQRRGKTAGLNRFVPELRGEIVTFSDANAMYEAKALRMLVRNFADPNVGYVTGEARYAAEGTTGASLGERAYWNYEMLIKRLETQVGSMVGGDGAIYAIRRELWKSLPEEAINDFLNPLQIVAAGWRGVYEPDAVAYEQPAGSTTREYRRRVRIVSRSWRAVFQAPGVLNPFRVGLFTYCLVSHKVLRWVTGVFLIAAMLALGMSGVRFFDVAPVRATVFAAALTLLTFVWPPARKARAACMYFVVISVASLVGIFNGSIGRVSGVWLPPRAQERDEPVPVFYAGPGMLTIALIAVATCVAVGSLLIPDAGAAHRIVFWSATAAMVYVGVLYPLFVTSLRPLFRREIVKSSIEPSVCLLVAAYNEATVIKAKLQNSLELDYPRARFSIVIASDGSTDGTNEIVRAFEPHGVRLLAYPTRRGKIAAINEGMRSIQSEIVVLSDANTFLDRGAIRALVRNFADETVGGVSGNVILVGDRAALGKPEDLYYWYERWLQQAESDLGSMLGVDGALYAIRRSLFQPPPADTILDDMAIPMAVVRAGRRVIFEPLAVAHEQGCESATEEFARKSRVVAGALQFLLRRDSSVPGSRFQVLAALISHKALRWLSPVFAILAFAASLVLADESQFFLTAAIAQSAFLGLGLLGCIPTVRRVSPFGLAHYIWLVQAAAAVGLVRGLFGKQPVAWRRFQRTPVEVAQ